MNSWLIGFMTEISGAESDKYVLMHAENPEMAEAAAVYMGRTWWAAGHKEYDGCCWQYLAALVWVNSIQLLDETEERVLHRLHFLDVWNARGTPENTVVLDEHAENWLDFVR